VLETVDSLETATVAGQTVQLNQLESRSGAIPSNAGGSAFLTDEERAGVTCVNWSRKLDTRLAERMLVALVT